MFTKPYTHFYISIFTCLFDLSRCIYAIRQKVRWVCIQPVRALSASPQPLSRAQNYLLAGLSIPISSASSSAIQICPFISPLPNPLPLTVDPVNVICHSHFSRRVCVFHPVCIFSARLYPFVSCVCVSPTWLNLSADKSPAAWLWLRQTKLMNLNGWMTEEWVSEKWGPRNEGMNRFAASRSFALPVSDQMRF